MAKAYTKDDLVGAFLMRFVTCPLITVEQMEKLISEGLLTDEDVLEELNREAMLALTDPKRRDRGKRVNRVTFDAVHRRIS